MIFKSQDFLKDLYLQEDPGLVRWQIDLCKSTARQLDRLKMIRFDERNGKTSGCTKRSNYKILHHQDTFIRLISGGQHPITTSIMRVSNSTMNQSIQR